MASDRPFDAGGGEVQRCSWYDEDEDGRQIGDPCAKPAAFYSCAIPGYACAEHKCRCKQSAHAKDPPSDGYTFEDLADKIERGEHAAKPAGGEVSTVTLPTIATDAEDERIVDAAVRATMAKHRTRRIMVDGCAPAGQEPHARAVEVPSVMKGAAHRAVDEMRRDALEADAARRVRKLTGAGPYRSPEPECGALIGPEGESCGVPAGQCREHRSHEPAPAEAQRCPTCGSPVRVVGTTTMHYEPVPCALMAELHDLRKVAEWANWARDLLGQIPAPAITELLVRQRRELLAAFPATALDALDAGKGDRP